MRQLQRDLLRLLSDGEFHSGQHLAEALNLTRSAIWKELKQWQSYGLEIEVVHRRGYRLPKCVELLDESCIRSFLSPNENFSLPAMHVFTQLNSTNQYLLENLNLPTSTVCLAEYQITGRGRRGRSWTSPFAANVYMSLLWRYENGVVPLIGLSLALGIAIVRALKRFGVQGIGLKWPNDIYYQQKKLGGILLEMQGGLESMCYIVIGIGLNVSMPHHLFTTTTYPVTDISSIVGQNISRNQVVAILLQEILPMLRQFQTKGLEAYLNEWQAYDVLYQQPICVHTPRGEFEGIARGIDKWGNLQVECADGTVQSLNTADITVRRIKNDFVN